MRQGRITPWLYLLPALVVMIIFIVYPGFNTLYLSLRNATDTAWASESCAAGQSCWGIFENYRYALTSSDMLVAFGNTLKWILFMVTGTVGLGLAIAVLADRVRYESIAKAIIFMPMAISFVGAGVIWAFVYDYGTDPRQIGLLNALVVSLGEQPVSWLTESQINTGALILVGVWMWTGFCMTILAAAIKGVPIEILEAARVDGASEWVVFWQITVPYIMPTITAVITTMIINVLKVFDIIYVMTGGFYDTQNIATSMIQQRNIYYQTGRASAIVVVLIIMIVPAMIFNIRRFREQEAAR